MNIHTSATQITIIEINIIKPRTIFDYFFNNEF